MTLITVVECNVCGKRLRLTGDRLDDAYAMMCCGGTASPWRKITLSRGAHDYGVHICENCLHGIQNAQVAPE